MLAGAAREIEAVRVHNPDGASPFLIVCDHASNFMPPQYGTLGLPTSDLDRHIAWDPGALTVSLGLSKALDATVVQSCISRLVIDCNRPLDASNLFWTVSEDTLIPGNQNLDDTDRKERIALAYTPFHEAIERVIKQRLARGQDTWLVAMHSFTPVYNGVARPWHIGIIHDAEERLSIPLLAGLNQLDAVNVGINEPYSPADKVYFTVEKHARSRNLPCVMIEIRNDEITDAERQHLWTSRLADILRNIETDMHPREVRRA